MSDANSTLKQTINQRTAFWSSIGRLDSNIYTPIINPTFSGGPKWPSLRQGFRRVTTNDQTVILTTDGLSDPFEDQPDVKVNGFELEFYIHTDTIAENPAQSWQFDLLNQMAQNAAHHGGIKAQLDQYRVLTTELYAKTLPQHFLNQSGRVGVLLGVQNPDIPNTLSLPFSPIKLVSLILLTLKELEYVVGNGREGREALAKKLAATTKTLTTLNRPSII
jgi:hypothetical protein